MEPKLAIVLEECLQRIREGTSIDVCLAEHEDMRRELEPLLYVSQFVSKVSQIQPREEFRETARGRLMARIQEETVREKGRGFKPGISLPEEISMAAERLWHTVAGAQRVVIPVAVCLVMVMMAFLGVSNLTAPSSVLASGCTLSILDGTVKIQTPEMVGNQPGMSGMTLDVGTRVMTAQDSEALLTFFDGSTLKLEPNTDIEIQELEFGAEETVTIVLKQWVGKTWSRVVKMADAGSHYEIQTPSAVALVRGTRFVTEVDDEGETTVQTAEGLVSVFAHGNEVFVSPGFQTTVEHGTPPSKPIVMTIAGGEKPETPVKAGQPENTQQNTIIVQGSAYGQYRADGAQGNAYGLNKDEESIGQGNAYGLNKDENNIGQGNAYGLNKDENNIGQGNDQNNGQGNDQNNGKGNDQNNGQGNDQNNGQGNDQNNGKGNDQNNGKGQGKGQGNAQSEGLSGSGPPDGKGKPE